LKEVKSTGHPKISYQAIPSINAINHHLYKRGVQPMSDAENEVMIERWGSWTLVNNKERHVENYYDAYSNLDIPRSKFPKNPWPIDT
jgi:hypothetical protein